MPVSGLCSEDAFQSTRTSYRSLVRIESFAHAWEWLQPAMINYTWFRGTSSGGIVSEWGPKLQRRLYAWEVDEFRSIFGSSLSYHIVWIHECTPWPDWADRMGRRLKRMPPPDKLLHNAITLGNHCYFPVALPGQLPPVGDRESYNLDWLVHELTHVWQFQAMGWKYLWLAVRAQLKDGALAYDFGGEGGLVVRSQNRMQFKNFNPEQQGNIVQSYYVRKRAMLDVSAWEPFINDLRS